MASPFDKAMKTLASAKVAPRVVKIDEAMYAKSRPHFPSGLLAVDYLIGGRLNSYGVQPCPGWPKGRLIQLYGKPGAGKTTMALMACAQACRQPGGTAVYIDFENEVDIFYARTLGVPTTDPDKFRLVQPETLEEGIATLKAMVDAGVTVVVVDSVGAGVPKALADEKLGDVGGSMRLGLVASQWSRYLPGIKGAAEVSGTTVFGISQLRSNPGKMGMGPDYTVAGGNAWQFFTCIRMFLAPTLKEKAKYHNTLTHTMEERVVGTKVKIRLDKCKVSDSFYGEQVVFLRSGTGFDDLRTVIDMAISYKIIKKGGAWLTWNLPPSAGGEEKRYNGMAQLCDAIANNNELRSVLFAQITPLFGSTEAVEGGPVDPKDLLDDDIVLEDVDDGGVEYLGDEE